MKIVKNISLVLLLMSIGYVSLTQIKYADKGVNVIIKGTSTLHDWEMVSKEGKCDAAFSLNGDKLTGVTSLSFVVAAETLKSGTNGLDKNGYKALNTKKYPSISFYMTSGAVTPVDATTYQFKGQGNLTIAGTTRLTDINATLKYNPADKSFTCSGTKTIKMTDWKVTPPTLMFGTIKTGDQLSIIYNLKIK
jgi:polyisoprenoid-binding protein YceI